MGVGYDKSVKTLVRITWIPVLIVVLYTGWVLWQRYSSNAPPVTHDPLAKYGDQVQIVQFYSSTGAITAGAKALLCYGVLNAKVVRLDPHVERVWPALSRCFDVVPARTTRYTLTAEGADGKAVSQSLEIVVRER